MLPFIESKSIPPKLNILARPYHADFLIVTHSKSNKKENGMKHMSSL